MSGGLVILITVLPGSGVSLQNLLFSNKFIFLSSFRFCEYFIIPQYQCGVLKMKTIFSLILMVLTFSSGTAATGIPGGDISGIWLKSDSPFLITGDVTIPADSLLIIEPGVQVTFSGHYALYVQGRLLAVGTEDDSIRFTVNDTSGFNDPQTSAGGWNGIRFIDTPANNDSSLLSYCRLQYGKAIGNVWHINTGGALCVINFDKLEVTHCLFYNNIAGGMMESPSGGAVHLAWADIRLSANIFAHNFAVAGGGAIQMHESNPVFENNIFLHNRAQTGGAVQIDGNSLPFFTNDRILNNQAVTHGGGIQIYAGSALTCTGVSFEGNTAQWGGGIGAAGAVVQVTSCTFTANKVDLWGGGIAGDYADLTITDCLFSSDSSGWGSGGLHTDHATAIISGSVFEKNTAVFGGGTHHLFSTIKFDQCTFKDNMADDAAGIHIENSNIGIDSCRFEKNIVQNANAAFQFRADSLPGDKGYDLKISHTVFKENSSPGLVAGVAIDQTDTLKSLINVQIDHCDFIDNQAYRVSGLRLYGKSEQFLISNCKFSGNIATTQNAAAQFVNNCTGRVENCLFSSNRGGACLTINQHPVIDIFNCTFAGNTEAVVAGLSLRRGAKVFLTNSIFWGNSAEQIRLTTAAGSGCELSVNYCCIQDGPDSVQVSDSLSILNWGSGNIAGDPQFVDSASADFHLQDASPCIGSGVNCILTADSWSCAPTHDLEGNPRPYPHGSVSDMGAYEHVLPSPTGLGTHSPVAPFHFQLEQNYPNPFNPVTTIAYQIPDACHVDLSIYNCLGQKIKTLVRANQSAGNHQAVWQTEGIASGIYFYRLQAGQVKQVKKMLLLE